MFFKYFSFFNYITILCLYHFLTPNSRSVFCAGMSLNIHSFILSFTDKAETLNKSFLSIASVDDVHRGLPRCQPRCEVRLETFIITGKISDYIKISPPNKVRASGEISNKLPKHIVHQSKFLFSCIFKLIP